MKTIYRLRCCLGYKNITLKQFKIIDETDRYYEGEPDYMGRHIFSKDNEEQVTGYVGSDSMEVYTLSKDNLEDLAKDLKESINLKAKLEYDKAKANVSIAEKLSIKEFKEY